MDQGLYIVATPIGNLGDITLRAIDTLKQADLILAEDTRHTRKLLNHYDIKTPTASCHKFNEAARVGFVLRKIQEEGSAVALVTDAGTPAVSDPGARVVHACRLEGVRVEVVPGPSAVTAAVALSGLCGGGFLFEGFLSHKGAARRRRLTELAGLDVPVVLFESPHRFLKLLDELEDVVGEQEVFVARELTKKFEEGLSGLPAELKASFQGRAVKGEFVVVIAPAARRGKRLASARPDGSGRRDV